MEVYQQYVLSVGSPTAVSKLTPTHLEAQRPSRPRYPRTKCVNHPVHLCVIMNAMINGICLHCCSVQPLNLISYVTTSAVFRARRVKIHCRHVAGQRETAGISRVAKSVGARQREAPAKFRFVVCFSHAFITCSI